MQGIRPEHLTNSELRKYAWLQGLDKLPPEWLHELAKRFIDPQSVPADYRS